MIAFIKTILAILFGAIIGFGIWYLVGWFLSGEPNMLLWDPMGKLVYLFFGFMSTAGMIEELGK